MLVARSLRRCCANCAGCYATCVRRILRSQFLRAECAQVAPLTAPLRERCATRSCMRRTHARRAGAFISCTPRLSGPDPRLFMTTLGCPPPPPVP